MAKTLGLWRLEGDALYDADGQAVAWATHDNEGNNYLGVNADYEFLLTAAPALLAACEIGLGPDDEWPWAVYYTLRNYEDWAEKWREKMRAETLAIAAAKGENDGC